MAGFPLLTYLRYNVDLRKESAQKLNPRLTDFRRIESLSAMDAPENMALLHKLGKLAGERDVSGSDFASHFALPVDE